MCVAYYAAIRRSSHGMNVNCVTTTTAGAGRSARDGIIIHNNTSEDRRYYDQQQQGQGAPSVTSTMRSQATTLPEDRHQLKAKGHYSGTSTVELYFAWFSAITFIGELVIGELLNVLLRGELQISILRGSLSVFFPFPMQ